MPSFQIVQVMEDGTLEPVPGFPPYEDGKLAKFYANQLQMSNPDKKYQPRPMKVENDTGGHRQKTLIPIPFWDFFVDQKRASYKPKIKLTFLDPMYDPKAMVVRYFFDEDHKKSGKSTSMDLMTFMQTCFNNEKEQSFWIKKTDPEWFDKNYTFGIARTEDEITEVYYSGVGSCMSKADGYYVEEYLPIRCYATDDFGVAWVRDRTTKKLKSRAVVSPTRNIHSRIYGNQQVLTHFLKANGFMEGMGTDWFGLKFPTKHVEGSYISGEEPEDGDDDDYDTDSGRGYVAPYLDFWQTIALSDDRKWFEISPDGTFEACSTNGVAEGDIMEGDWDYECSVCKKGITTVHSYDEGYYCHVCATNKYGLVAHSQMPPDSYDLSSRCSGKHTHDGYLVLNESYYYKTCSITRKIYTNDELPYIFNEIVTPAEAKAKYDGRWAVLEDAFLPPSRKVRDRGSFYQKVPAST